MKKWIAIQSAIVIVVLIFGLVGKSSFQDRGIIGIRTIEDVKQLNCNVNQVFVDDEFALREEATINKLMQNLEAVENIFVVVPTNSIHQYNFSVNQEVQIEQVIKGNSAQQGDIVELVSTGGVYDQKYRYHDYQNTNPIFFGLTNFLLPNNRYLVFVNPLSTNEYTDVNMFRIETNLFHVLNLTSDYSIPIDDEITNVSYNDFLDSEFFCESQSILDKVIEIKHRIIEYYVPTKEL